MLAVTPVQQSVAFVVVGIVAVGFVLWLVANTRRAKPEIGSEIELAANRKPYYDDDGMEGRRLDGMLKWAFWSLLIVAIGLPAYWLAEPGRQAGAVKDFERRFWERGEELSLPTAEGGFNCQGCHGGVSGGLVQYNMTDPETREVTPVMWSAPSLDDVALRMTEDQLREVLTYGRLFSPMPAWGLAGGGPMNEQQIDNLIAWLNHIAITPEEARERTTQAAAAQRKLLADPQPALAAAEESLAKLQAAPESTEVQILTAKAQVTMIEAIIDSGQQDSEGAALFNMNCARCHTIGWSYSQPGQPGSGAFGPSLSNVLNKFQLPQDQVDFVAEGKTFGEKFGSQGKASGFMPHFNAVLSKEQIEAIVGYERDLAAAATGEQEQ